MRQSRLRAVGVVAGLGLAAGALFFGPLEAAASTWSIVSSPNSGTGNNYLFGVSCLTSSSCTAVGSYNGGAQVLIESWNGTSWSIVPSPSTVGNNYLSSVSCASFSFCTAVGSINNGAQTLIETWNGTSWSIVPSPNRGTSPDFLVGVACVSSSSCTAVGSFHNGVVSQTLMESLIELLNGSRWSIAHSPNSGTSYNWLYGVACFSFKSCTAVGGVGNGTQTLIESGKHNKWSIASSPDIGNANALTSVACISSGSCTAVGYYVNSSSGVFQTLIESE